MIHCFNKRSTFLITVFFVFFENHGSLIPYDFCSKKIKRNPAYEKISVSNQPGVLFCSDIWQEVGMQYLNANNESFGMLNKWTQSFSLNQYVNFIVLVSNLAKKIKFDVNIVLSFIDEKYENDFFDGVQAVKMYKKMYKKLSKKIEINDRSNLLTSDEYSFLKNVLIGKYALVTNKNTVFVERSLIEKIYPTGYQQLAINLIGMQIMNIGVIIPVYGIGMMCGLDLFPAGTVLVDILSTPFQTMWCIFWENKSLPILKSYEPKIIKNR